MLINDLFSSKDTCHVCGQTPCNCTHIAESHDDYEDCSRCNGSGEGRYEGQSCSHCHGSGVEPAERDNDDFDIPDDDYSDSGDEESYYEKSLRSRGLGEGKLKEVSQDLATRALVKRNKQADELTDKADSEESWAAANNAVRKTNNTYDRIGKRWGEEGQEKAYKAAYGDNPDADDDEPPYHVRVLDRKTKKVLADELIGDSEDRAAGRMGAWMNFAKTKKMDIVVQVYQPAHGKNYITMQYPEGNYDIEEDVAEEQINEISPHNFDSDEDYYAAVRRGNRKPSYDDDYDDYEDEPQDDDEESYYEKSLRSRGLGEGANNVGASIKALCQKIYDQGDDEFEYFYHESPIFAQYWDEYEGDLDSIIAEVDPAELQVMLDELESYVQQANLEEDISRRGFLKGMGAAAAAGSALASEKKFEDYITDVLDKEKYLTQKKRANQTWALSITNSMLRAAAYAERAKLSGLKKELAKKYNINDNVNEQGMTEGMDLGRNKYIVTYDQGTGKTYTALVPADDEYEATDRVRQSGGRGTMVQNVKLARGNEPTDKEWKVYSHPSNPVQSRVGLYDRDQGVAEARNGDVNFGHTVTRGSWVVHKDGKLLKRFKTHSGAKAYAEKSGGKVASSEFYADKVQKQGVAEGEQQKGADYRDPPEADYGDDYQDMVARVKKLAGLGPLKTVYDPQKRVYKNIPTAEQPKK